MAKPATKPNLASKPKNVAEFVHWQVHLCGKSQLEISEEAGFSTPNIITMLKQGKVRVPLTRAMSLAKALNIDPKHFLLMCLEEYEPELGKAVREIANSPEILTDNELEFVRFIRTNSPVPNPKLNTEKERNEFKAFLQTLKGDNLQMK